MIVIEALTPQKFAEEFMKEAESIPVFSEVSLVTEALPHRAAEAEKAGSSGWENLTGWVGESRCYTPVP